MTFQLPVDSWFPAPNDDWTPMLVSITRSTGRIAYYDDAKLDPMQCESVYVALGKVEEPKVPTSDQFAADWLHRWDPNDLLDDLRTIDASATTILPLVRKYGQLTWPFGHWKFGRKRSADLESLHPVAIPLLDTPFGEQRVLVLERVRHWWRLAAIIRTHIVVSRIVRMRTTRPEFKTAVKISKGKQPFATCLFTSYLMGDGWHEHSGWAFKRPERAIGHTISRAFPVEGHVSPAFRRQLLEEAALDALAEMHKYSPHAEFTRAEVELRRSQRGLVKILKPKSLWALASLAIERLYTDSGDRKHYCLQCDKAFPPSRRDANYCSASCRSKARHDRNRLVEENS